MLKLEGAFTAMVTPFSDGRLNEEKLREMVEFQIENGISGLVPVGTTGESPTLTFEEHKAVIERVVKAAAGQIPVIAGTGSNSTAEAIELTAHAAKIGADATLQVCPYYNKPTQEGFYQHFKAIAEEVDLPIVVYNIPGRSGKNIENPIMLRLAEHKNIVAVKEASGSIAQMMDLIAKKPKRFNVLSGDDNMTFPLMALGGAGVVSVASNIVPDRMKQLTQAALQGEWDRARQLHYELLPLFKGIFLETNPIPIKAAMAMKNFAEEVYRLPMCPLSPENKKSLTEILKQLKIL